MKLAAPLVLALSVTISLAAQTTFTDPANLRGERVRPLDGRELPIDQGSRGLKQLLRKLNTRASLMLIVAHPDDEDGGMLTYYSRGLGARVAVLTLTRGEGGQNAMTGDFGDALGLLRTQELLSADRYLGVDQFFGTEVDFGFSKTKEEAFRKWTHERVLYDAVRAIRLYRPLVIAAVFIGGVTDGHGQHQVSGQIAQEAFKAAGDPTVFPDMIAEGILPWQPLRVYARIPAQSITPQGLYDYATGKFEPVRFTNYVTGEVTTTPPTTDIIVHEGQTDPLLSAPNEPARSYVQFARMGLGLQKSQIGPGVRSAPSGKFDIAYHLYGSAICGSAVSIAKCHPNPDGSSAAQGATHDALSFFQDIDISLAGLANPSTVPPLLREEIVRLIEQLTLASNRFDVSAPATVAPQLAEAIHQTDRLLASVREESFGEKEDVLHELRVKHQQLNLALALALDLHLDATVQGANLPVIAQPVVATELRTSASSTLEVTREWLESATGMTRDALIPQQRSTALESGRPFIRTIRTAASLAADSQDAAQKNLAFTVSRPYFDRETIEAPVYHLKNPAFRNAPASPHALTAWATVSYKGVPITLGRIVHDGVYPLAFVPEVSVSFANGVQPTHTQLVIPSASSFITTLISDPADIKGERRSIRSPKGWSSRLRVEDSNPSGFARYDITVPSHADPGVLQAMVTTPDGQTSTEGYRTVGYGDLPRTNFFTPATLRVVSADVKLPMRRRTAYLPGTGDAVPEALASIGLPVDVLTVSDLTPTILAKYDSIVLGVRAYNAHPDLHGAPTQALLDYARNGGNVVLQYQTGEFTAADAPYTLSLGSNEKVVDETAPVSLSAAYTPLLSVPNRITSADFNNWVEERGHGFLGTWDSRYAALTETHDPGQDPQSGGLITVSLGKGRWTYCAFALYRQLPEAIPGAFRVLMNLLNP